MDISYNTWGIGLSMVCLCAFEEGTGNTEGKVRVLLVCSCFKG